MNIDASKYDQTPTEPDNENVEGENASQERTAEQRAPQKMTARRLIRETQQHPASIHTKKGVRLKIEFIAELNRTITHAVYMGTSGFWVLPGYGDERTSAAISRVKKLEKKSSGQVTIVRLNSVDDQAPTLRQFLVQILYALGVEEFRGETHVLRERLIRACIGRARLAKNHAVYLFVDEAQKLRNREMLFLKDLSWELEIEDVRLVTFLSDSNPGLSEDVAARRIWIGSANRVDFF